MEGLESTETESSDDPQRADECYKIKGGFFTISDPSRFIVYEETRLSGIYKHIPRPYNGISVLSLHISKVVP